MSLRPFSLESAAATFLDVIFFLNNQSVNHSKFEIIFRKVFSFFLGDISFHGPPRILGAQPDSAVELQRDLVVISVPCHGLRV